MNALKSEDTRYHEDILHNFDKNVPATETKSKASQRTKTMKCVHLVNKQRATHHLKWKEKKKSQWNKADVYLSNIEEDFYVRFVRTRNVQRNLGVVGTAAEDFLTFFSEWQALFLTLRALADPRAG